jgi:hypothetical protein
MDMILVSDSAINESGIGNSRYLGPYVLASKFRSLGLNAVVFDHASLTADLIERIVQAADEKTEIIGFSSTFMTPTNQSEDGGDLGYYRGLLWFDRAEVASAWFSRLRLRLAEKGCRAKLVVGGAKALYLAFVQESHAMFDFFVLGSADQTLVDLFYHLREGRHADIRKYGEINYLTAPPEENQSATLIQNIWSPNDAIRKEEGLPLELTRGCQYNCKFCHFEKQFSTRKDLGLLKEELIRNFENHGVRFYHFSDDCFNDRREKVETFCNMFLSLPFHIEWSAYARVDVACRFPETLDLMVNSGARGLFWGIESLNSEVARKVGKGTPAELVKEMFVNSRMKHRDNLLNHGAFIVGLPGESEESIWKSVDWIIESKTLDFVSLFPLSLRPYNPKLDKVVVDYADYSRNPEKYGFKKVSFGENAYWEHDQMNLRQAVEISNRAKAKLQDFDVNRSFVTSSFQYSHLRGLGFSQSEIFRFVRECRWNDNDHVRVKNANREAFETYSNRISV